MRSQYEQLIEFIINDQHDEAKELFHNLVVAKSRDIYNQIVAEEMDEEVEENMDHDMDEAEDMEENYDHDMDEAGDDMSMDQTDDMMHDIEADHDGMDNDDDGMEMHSDDMDMGDHEGDEGMEDRVMDLEDALEDLKAEFEKLMAQEKEEPEHQDHAEEGVVREYVEKVSAPSNSEGQPVGATNSYPSSTNTKGIVASKNDMGGTAKNLAQGQRNEDPNGKAYKGPKNEYTKGETTMSKEKFLNAPGGDAGKKGFSNAKKPVTSGDGRFATGGGVNVNKRDNLPR
jgi:hypothetical protein